MSVLKRGIFGGIVGSMAMGMWMMAFYLATGRGFWSPVAFIGHFVLRTGELVTPATVLLGLAIHMMMAAAIGVALAKLFERTTRIAGMMGGAGISLAIWVAMQYVVLNLLDKAAYAGFVPWAFALGHAIFGAMTGLIVADSTAESEAFEIDVASTPAH